MAESNSNRLIVSGNERINIYNRYFIDKGGSSTGEQIFQCGIHDYETKSLSDFNDHLDMTHNDTDTDSKAASVRVGNNINILKKYY